MQIVRIQDLIVEPNPVERNKTIHIQVKLKEYDRGQYARPTNTGLADIYAGETLMGRI